MQNKPLRFFCFTGFPFQLFLFAITWPKNLSADRLRLCFLGLSAFFVVGAASGQPVFALQHSNTKDQQSKTEFFENRIRPVLIKHCYECHSSDSDDIGGNLLLDSRMNLRAGGDLGPAIVPGKPDESLLLAALSYDDLEMPPSGKLDSKIIEDFEQWIRDGAIDPRTGKSTIQRKSIDIEKGRDFWSFKPLLTNFPVKDSVSQTIDALVKQKLIENGIEFSEPARSTELLERIYFDLIGLPPDKQTQEEFLADKIDLSEIVDRLLSSQHFGERFGRHWLDVARYADSSGGGRVLLFPDAWRYRNYVIDSFNKDKPFDQFVREQLAGDLLQAANNDHRREYLTATGFLMLGAHNFELQDKELLRMEVVDEQINVVGRAFLGLTLSCARCHDHKFDPIPTRDYYALAGIFRSTKSLLPGNVSQFVTTNLPLESAQQKKLDEFNQLKSKFENNIKGLQANVARLERSSVSFDAADLKSFDGVIVDEEQAELKGEWKESTSIQPFIGSGYRHSMDPNATASFRLSAQRTGRFDLRVAYTAASNRTDSARYLVTHSNNQKSYRVNQKKAPPLESHFALLTQVDLKEGESIEVTLQPGANGTTIADAVYLYPVDGKRKDSPQTQVNKERLEKLRNQLAVDNKKLRQMRAPFETNKVMSVKDESSPADFHVCIRGDVHSPGAKVKRNGLQVLGHLDSFQELQGSGRLELADWITDARNPLTARVYANRVWGWLFGRGLVATPDNFGATGKHPDNQKLLDYLAGRLIANQWSSKKLIREIVLSRTYRQSSTPHPKTLVRDPENQLWSRHPRKRLDAESIRDRILSFAGSLDRKPGRQSIKPGTKKEFGYRYDSKKRSVYLPVFRNTLNDLFEVFDFPNPNLVSGHRNASVLPTQALFMMNSSFVGENCRLAAQRIIANGGESFESQLTYAYQLALARMPSSQERRIAKRFFDLEESAGPIFDETSWNQFCQLLISSIDFQNLR